MSKFIYVFPQLVQKVAFLSPGLKLGQHLCCKGEELGHLSMRVTRDDGPVAVVVDAGLLELQFECVRAHLHALHAGVLLDGDTVLVPVNKFLLS